MSYSENISAPTKATSGRPAYSTALYQIKSAIAKLLISFRCRVKIREGQAEETACNIFRYLINVNRSLKREGLSKIHSSTRCNNHVNRFTVQCTDCKYATGWVHQTQSGD